MEIIEKTEIKKSVSGWDGETIVNKFGLTWQISTYRDSRGNIWCNAQSGTYKPRENGFSSFTFILFQDPNKALATEKARGTEKSIAAVHAKGLEVFSRLNDYK